MKTVWTSHRKKRSVKVLKIKILLKWKLNKILPGIIDALIQLYFDAPDPQDFLWSNMQEQELLKVKSDVIGMQETAVALARNRRCEV